MGRYIKLLSIFILFFVVLCIICIGVITDLQPNTAPSGPASPPDFASLATLSKTAFSQKHSNQDSITITLSEHELSSLARVLESQVEGARVNIVLVERQIQIDASIPIFKHLWLNGSATKSTDSNALPDTSRIGKIGLPKKLSTYLSRLVLKELTGDGKRLDMISLIILEDAVTLTAQNQALSEIKFSHMLSALSKITTPSVLVSDSILNDYRKYFIDYSKSSEAKKSSHGIAGYLSLIDKVAAPSNALSQQEHIEYSLIALSTFTGVQYYNKLFPILEDKYLAINFRLAGRTDLAKHFLLSAAIRILSNKQTSFNIGAAKELLDSRGNGSGFSFVDLAADRVGIALVDHVANSAAPVLSISDESDFYPAVDDLREGLSEQEFIELFESTDSPEYAAVVSEIDSRIAAMPFFN